MITILNGLWWGFLRRWFGGLFSDNKILGSRGVQTAVMLISLFPVMLFSTKEVYSNVYVIYSIAIALTLWIQFQFWSRGHGATFLDMGRTENPDLSRYDRWFKIPLDYIWNKMLSFKATEIGGFLLQRWSGRMYGYTYDMVYHICRYSLCMIVPSIILHNWIYFVIGLLSAPLYELSIRLYEKYHFKWMDIGWLSSPNKPVEIVYGFIFGAGILL